jgi:glycerol-3-phosphate dehydrogenase (NAD(P)+)
MTTEEITRSTRQVAEGVKSCSSLLALAEQSGVYAPIVNAVHDVVEGEMTAADMLTALISKETKHERD